MILTKLVKKDFEKLCKLYDLGTYKSSEHIDFALENSNYIFKTSKGKYVVKLFQQELHFPFVSFSPEIPAKGLLHLFPKRTQIKK